MTFSETLNQYMERYSLTISALSQTAGISKSVISRFRTGQREPSAERQTVEKLSASLAAFAEEKGFPDTESEIHEALLASLKIPPTDNSHIRDNLNILIDSLGVNVNNLSRYLNFDPSYLSRIRSGKRFPANSIEFCDKTAQFVAIHYTAQSTPALLKLIDHPEESINTPETLKSAVMNWLLNNAVPRENPAKLFLQNLDSFDLNEYTRFLSFDTLSTKTSDSIPSTGTNAETLDYYDLTGFMEAELEWIDRTALSADGSVLLYSDMPMEKMAKDPEFPRKWMLGIALLLKKGLHLHIVHCIDRSFNEMMLGLISWIPLYMTGKVSPYYFKNFHDPVFYHFLRVSNVAVLSGEGIVGHHSNGRYRLSQNRDEIAYYTRYGENMLSKASPLMKIYHRHQADAYMDFLQDDYLKRQGEHYNILSSLPLYICPEALLTRLLNQNQFSHTEKERILFYARARRKLLEEQLTHISITDVVPLLSREEFALFPIKLLIADLFYEKEVTFTYDEYQECIRHIESYGSEYPSYQYRFIQHHPFRNIQIRMVMGKVAIISKNNSPAIHYVIEHPKLRQAIEDMSQQIV